MKALLAAVVGFIVQAGAKHARLLGPYERIHGATFAASDAPSY